MSVQHSNHVPPIRLPFARPCLALVAAVALCSGRALAQCGPPVTAELTPADPQFNGQYGVGIALDGDTLLVGRPIGPEGGAVYAYRDSGAGWTLEAQLPAPTVLINGSFGLNVDLDGDVAAIGGSTSLDKGYIARRSGTSWSIEATLTPLVPADAASFGVDVSIEGDWAVFGASQSNTPFANGAGSVYVFHRASGVWGQHSVLHPSDADTGDQFGYSVELRNGVLVAGSMRWSSALPGRAAAHVYRLIGNAWTLEAVLQPTSAGVGSYYGRRVATDGSVVLVSDIGDTFETNNVGVIYAYRWDGTSWSEEQQLRSAISGSHGYYGEELALEGDELATTANNAAGRVWHYRRVGGQWLELGVTTSTLSPGFSGWDVELDGSRLAVGSPTVDSGDLQSGAAYVFDVNGAALACTYCTAKVNSEGCTPQIGFSGMASASAPSGFQLTATQMIAGKPGIFFYARTATAATAFGGGTLCMKNPIERTSVQFASGSGACGGAYAFDFNAWIASGADPALVAGEVVRGQFWGRDSGFSPPNNVGLSDAISFVIAP
ncbi:MAG: hypothetical protein HZA52_20995 [Planctomycetes bacterium]|nr:hypothetical protein [Planctomycetota bacterium]